MNWESGCVRKSFACSQTHTHIHMRRAGVRQDPLPELLWCIGTAQPGETSMPDIHVVVFPPVSIPGEGFVARCWHRPPVKSDRGDIALHVCSSLRCRSPVTCWSRAPTKAHPTQFLSELPFLPWLIKISSRSRQGHDSSVMSAICLVGNEVLFFSPPAPFYFRVWREANID